MSSRSRGRGRQLAGLWLPVLAGFALSFYLSSQSGTDVPAVAPDYLIHGLEYGILGFLTVRALHGGLGSSVSPAMLVLAIVVCILWAIGDEYHQSLVPGREAELSDLISDAVGVLVGAAIFALLAHRRGAASGGMGRR